MGLFDRLIGRAGTARPEPVLAEDAPGVVCAPVSGRAVALADVPDPLFSCEAMGKGCAIWPEGEVVHAPVSGTVSVAMPHAVGITAEDGCEVLVHVGVDTVDMNGAGFSGFVAQGDRIAAGQPVLRFSREKIKGAGHPDVVMVIVTNSGDYVGVEMSAAAGESVAAGEVALRVTR